MNHEDPNGGELGDITIFSFARRGADPLAPHQAASRDEADKENLHWPRYDQEQENLVLQNNKTRVEKDDYRQEGRQFLIELGTGPQVSGAVY